MQRQKKEQGQRTRQSIIDVTTRLFAARGYAGTSLDLIAKEAQTSKSSIFWHFENKEDLLFTVVDKAMTDWELEAGNQILAQPDPPSQLAKLIDEYQELAIDRPDTLRLLLGLLLETADANENVKRRFQKMYRGYRKSIQLIIDEGLQSGYFSRHVNGQHLASMILALFDGLFIQWFLDAESVPADTFETLKQSVFALVLPSVANPS